MQNLLDGRCCSAVMEDDREVHSKLLIWLRAGADGSAVKCSSFFQPWSSCWIGGGRCSCWLSSLPLDSYVGKIEDVRCGFSHFWCRP
ncbi:hypothetical protein VIGAN_UM012000 [Vigna angularis var. angularis]|uniref:Uncharacterized protein n=1 Tax=Vigna angularis var. angularis TaxID=157739 RepID=A0A0S3TDB1_PHAAN|nr:hypothetical protein VIGAN_UM012000 [Vigna angularis var. angularis]